MNGRRRIVAGAAALAAAAGLAACGTASPDLFVVTRTGAIPGAKVTLRVGDGGTVRCNRGKEREITSDDLITARKIAREINGKDDDHPGPAVNDLDLKPQPGSVLRYNILSEKGTVSFSDTSKGQPAAFFLAAKFTRDIAQRICGLPR